MTGAVTLSALYMAYDRQFAVLAAWHGQTSCNVHYSFEMQLILLTQREGVFYDKIYWELKGVGYASYFF